MNLASLSPSEAAELFGVDERTVRNWLADKNLPFVGTGKRRRIVWAPARAWWRQQIADEIGSIGKKRSLEVEESYEDALARKTRAEADLKELQLAQARGEVASISDFERVVTTANMAVQTQLLSIPSQAAPEIIGLTDLPAAIRVLTTHVEQALSNLATVDDIREAAGVKDDDD